MTAIGEDIIGKSELPSFFKLINPNIVGIDEPEIEKAMLYVLGFARSQVFRKKQLYVQPKQETLGD